MNSEEHANLEQEYQRLRAIKAQRREQLLSLPNVNGIGIGRKIVKGKYTDERVLRVYVVEKKPLRELEPHQVIPPELDSVPTDVIQIGMIRPTKIPVYTDHERPAQGGASIGRADGTGLGTLGCLCIDNTDGTRVILSNNHVFAKADDVEWNGVQVGNPVTQPDPGDGGIVPDHNIATLKRWIQFKFPPLWNLVDAAVAEVINHEDVSPFIHQIGMPTGTRRLTFADEGITTVQKCGRTTGHRQGLVEDIDFESSINYERGVVQFEDQILIRDINSTPFVLRGDSGSVVLDMTNNLIGLVYARGDTYTVLNHIDNVFTLLDLSIYIPPKVRALASDGSYLYAALTSAAAEIIKIDPFTMTTLTKWSHGQGGANARALVCNGNYLFAALYAAPARVEKIGAGDMQTKATWTGQANEYPCYALTLDDSYLYVGLATIPARVVKVKISSMTTDDAWTGESGQDDCQALSFDGAYVYVGLNTSPARVIKLNTTDMTLTDSWTGAEGQNSVTALFFDGSFLYAALATSPAQVVKIEPLTMTTISTWTGAEGQNDCVALTSDSLSLHAGLATSPAQVVKIRTSDMTTISTWTGAEGEDNLSDLLFDGLFTFISLMTTPASIVRKVLRDVDETGA